MCGILVEFYNRPSTLPARADLRLMLDEMRWRGSDQVTVKEYAPCTVAFRRLAITDRDVQQPGRCGNADATWEIWMNGEIYNYRELGFKGTETEVLAQGFAKFGPSFVSSLNGMFIILAIQGDDVYLFRDRWGQKPAYYFETKAVIVISSEIKPLLKHPEYKFGVNQKAREQLLVFCNVFTDDTLFEGIKKIPKGTWWHLNTGERMRYWEWSFHPDDVMDYGEALAEVRRLVEQSIKRQFPGEVDYATCLSGGIDSGIIASLSGVPCFTVGYKEQEDERRLSELASKGIHYEVVYGYPMNVTETIFHLETPLLGESWMHWKLYDLASRFVKVLFDGAGGDELFGGYSWRYEAKDYWGIVNRTGIESEYCREVFKGVFPEDTPYARYRFDAVHFLESVLLVVDRLSMAHTIEVRCPFLDNDLADFAQRIPYEYKRNKAILKDAFKDLLPPEIRMNRKQGFTTPAGWIAGTGNRAANWMKLALSEWDKMFNFVK